MLALNGGQAFKDFGLGVFAQKPVLRSQKSLQAPEGDQEKGQSRQAKMQKRRRQRKWLEDQARRLSELPLALTGPATSPAEQASRPPAQQPAASGADAGASVGKIKSVKKAVKKKRKSASHMDS